MSGIVGHTMYALLAEQKLRGQYPAVAVLLKRNLPSFLAGAYLGCDIQTLPEAVCVDTGEEVGYGTVPLERSPLTGGPVRPWTLDLDGAKYRAREIHDRFYGRAHLVFGWSAAERRHAVPWDHLADYAAMTFQDAIDLFPPSEAKLAYLFGWLVHIVGDSLIKSIRPGLEMKLLDGLYTPRNRPVQDLVTYHEVGVKELGLDWPKLLGELATAPVEPVQAHYMRAAKPRGVLSQSFTNAWSPADEKLLTRICDENRRYLRKYLVWLLPRYELTKVGGALRCDPELSRQSGGLNYGQMVAEARRAALRDALSKIADEAAALCGQVIERVSGLDAGGR